MIHAWCGTHIRYATAYYAGSSFSHAAQCAKLRRPSAHEANGVELEAGTTCHLVANAIGAQDEGVEAGITRIRICINR